ncbi:MAG: hypothetical protein ABIP78_00395 [Pyrinomonadaceae bacterium]
MLNNGNKINCGFSDEIVSYIYDEIGVAERSIFETHLADCPVCTDEFAAISNARFSVFEWQREEFSPLLTPEIIIPYAAKQRVVAEDAQVGILAGLRGLFGVALWPAAAAASLLLCLGLGFIAMNYFGSERQIAANVNVPATVVPTQNVDIAPSNIENEVPSTLITKDNPGSAKEINNSEIRAVKTVGSRRPSRQTTAFVQRSVDIVPQRNMQNSKAPVLSSYEDNDDKSLRLSDLFEDEVGAKR